MNTCYNTFIVYSNITRQYACALVNECICKMKQRFSKMYWHDLIFKIFSNSDDPLNFISFGMLYGRMKYVDNEKSAYVSLLLNMLLMHRFKTQGVWQLKSVKQIQFFIASVTKSPFLTISQYHAKNKKLPLYVGLIEYAFCKI